MALSLHQRAITYRQEMKPIFIRCSTIAFSNICSHRNGRSKNLVTKSVLLLFWELLEKRIHHDDPILSLLVYYQFLITEFTHLFS